MVERLCDAKYTYVCGRYHAHKEECTPHTIKALHLRELVLLSIQAVCESIQGDRDAFIEHILSKRSRAAKSELSAKHRELEQGKRRLKELDSLTATAFEKLATGVLNDEQFKELSSRYTNEKHRLSGTLPVLEQELEQQSEELENVSKFLAIVDKYLNPQELTPQLFHEFVHHVVVHERSVPHAKKNYTQDVDIYFNYIGIIN